MKSVFSYDSVHQYLDEVLADVSHPTDNQIADAKKQYWRLYLDDYQQKRRSNIKEYTLGFDRQLLQLIHQKRETLNVSQFLYRCVFGVLENNRVIDITLLKNIHANQLEIIANLEELLDGNTTTISEVFLEKMETLELQIVKLKDGDY